MLAARSVLATCVRTMSASVKRGAFIVFEGCDRAGKSTQCSLLVERLNKSGVAAQLMKFPDRTTPMGKMINNYLQQSCQMEDHAIHLLFAANRWEAMPKMTELLNSGVTLIVDRYSFSGVAYSSAKPGIGFNWCKQPERGLLRPDRVFYLEVSPKVAAQRGDYGAERYEKKDFLATVATMFDKLKDETWLEIDADKTIDQLSDEIFEHAMNVITAAQIKKVDNLWTDDPL